MKPVVAVRTQYTRSVNLERDFATDAVIRSYIPTTRALETMKRLADTLQDGNMPRAWALVGPYGSGKSCFSVFLAALLSRPGKVISATAAKILKNHDKDLAARFRHHLTGSAGYCRVLLTGSPEPLAPRIVQALYTAALELWSAKRGKNPAVLSKLEALTQESAPAASAVMEGTRELLTALDRIDCPGIVLIIDELGKFLEYEARHYGANDIFLLQSLAELAYRGEGPKLHCIVLLHQSFEQYAQGLGETLRNEWYKVQGRFETVPFVEAAEQVLRVVAAALDSSGLPAGITRSVRRYSQKAAKTLAASSGLPNGLTESKAAALFAACYPLHPLAALILPSLCQKVAQNERTLFSYLGSQEPFGFRDSIARLEGLGDWVLPWHIYDYFVLNQPRVVGDPITQRRWAEVVTALERLGDTGNDEACILKVIGLLNIIGAHAGLKASRDVVALAHTQTSKAERAAEALRRKSIIQYRKFSGEYRVWQGSDFDLDLAVQSELATLGKFSLAQHLNERAALQPIVVRGHSIRTATLRYFSPVFVDASLWRRLDKECENPRLIMFLAEAQDDFAFFLKEVVGSASDSDVVALVPNGAQLRAIVAEVLSLERIHRTTETLNTDPVAAREFKDRWEAASLAEHDGVGGLLDRPEQKRWFWRRAELSVRTKRNLQEELSRVLDGVYSGSPIFRNELINRNSPSSTANAARNKLLFSLLTRSAMVDLGFEKFPAEKAMYRALLQATGFHQPSQNGWALSFPSGATDPYNVRPMWAEVERFLGDTEHGPLPLSELDRRLTQVPFGVKKGVLPFIYALALLIYKDELAIYEDGLYTPTITDELLERLARRPQTFCVQRFRLEGLRAALLSEYAVALFSEQKQDITLLAVAQPLVQFIAGLPDYAKRTKSLSSSAQGIRAAVMYSKSPAALVFKDLPIACGYPDFSNGRTDESAARGFAEALITGLRELRTAYAVLLKEVRAAFASALGADSTLGLGELRRLVGGRYVGLERYSLDADGLSAFVRRLTSGDGDDDTWFERVLLFLGRKPSAKWDDQDRSTAEFRLSEFSRRMNDLEKLQMHYEGKLRRRDDGLTVRLVRVVKQGEAEHEQLLVSDSEQEPAVQAAASSVLETIANMATDQLRIAALGEAIARIASAEMDSQSVTGVNLKPAPETVNV
jgi:hypothetical protein